MSLHCITSSACESYPNWLPSPGEVLSIEDKENDERRSELKLTASWTDDGKTLTCRSSGNHGDSCLDRSIDLIVECGYR